MKRFMIILYTLLFLMNGALGLSAQEDEASLFTSCDNQFSFEYPETWAVEENAISHQFSTLSAKYTTVSSHIILANSLETLTKKDLEIGDYRIYLNQHPTPSELPRNTPAEWLVLLKVDSIRYGSILELDELSNPSAIRYFSVENSVGLEVVMALPTFDLQITAEAKHQDDLLDLEQTTLNFIETITTPLLHISLDKLVYFEDDCAVKFYYPSGWLFATYGNRVFLFNSAEAENTRFTRQPFSIDEISIEIITPDKISRYFADSINPSEATSEEIMSVIINLNSLSALNNRQPIQIDGVAGIQENLIDGWVFVLEHEQEYSVIMVRGGENALIEFEDDILDMISSLEIRKL